MSVKTVTAGGADTSVELSRLYEIINILGKRDCRMLLPLFETDPADDEDVQDFSQRGNHFSAMNTVAFDNDPVVQGEVLAYRLNGVDEALDMADHDDFSFGADGTAPNEPSFSLVIAYKFNDTITGALISRYDETNLAEKTEFSLNRAGVLPRFLIFDDDSANYIGRRAPAQAIDEWFILIATYNGSRVSAGIRLFANGVRIDNLSLKVGNYIAMHNTTVITSVGYIENAAGVLIEFPHADIALPAITARCLTDGGVAEGAAAAPFSDVARLTRLYQEVLGI